MAAAYIPHVPFAPVIAIELSTPVPKAPPAITSTVTLPDGDSAIASVSLVFPKAFGFNERFHPQRCQPDDEAARTCPEASRIGSVAADSPLGSGSGGIFLSDDFRLLVFADALGGAIQIKAEGNIRIAPSGGFLVTFSGLPDLPLRSVDLNFDGDDRALVKNPTRCAVYQLPVHFVAHDGSEAEASPELPITGCVDPVGGLRAAVAGRTATLRWAAPGADETEVRLLRGATAVTTRRTSASKLTFASLKAGRYLARVRAFSGGRASPARTVRFRVRSSAGHRRRAAALR
jgi:hypothetical protein